MSIWRVSLAYGSMVIAVRAALLDGMFHNPKITGVVQSNLAQGITINLPSTCCHA